MKTWKHLVSGLLALTLLASLAGSALAAFTGEELSDHNAVWAMCRLG